MKLRPFPYSICLFCLSFCFILPGCSDIIEPSISHSTVTLEAPVNQYLSTSYTVNFWWDQVNNSLTYHLQVVTPSFEAPGALVLDTVVKKNTFSFNLNPGNYQWRVLAENGSSQTAFAGPRSFTVAATSIKQQAVQLMAPANNLLTRQATTTFQWGLLYGATKYQVEIDTNNFIDESAVLYNQAVPGQQISFTFPKNQTYQWRVRAENDTAQAQWSAIYQVTYDHTPPAAVTLTAPSDGSVTPVPVTLQWSASAGSSAYKLYIYQSDSKTLYNQNFPLTVNGTSYSFNSGSSGNKFYWTVTAVDAAGNESQAAPLQSFSLQ
jgi:hypothetical protein